MASYSDILFGKIALANRLITPAQLQQALASSSRGGLADALVKRGLLTREQAQRVQRAQALTQFMRAERIYARICLDRRLADVATLRECFARQEQAQHRVRIGQLLVERRIITPEQNEEIVEEQLHRLAEETARLEEAGFGGDVGEGDDLKDVVNVRAAADLDGSMVRRAVGPRGLLDQEAAAPAEVERTLELPDPRGPRTMVVAASHVVQSPPAAAPAAVASGDDLVGRTVASRYRVLEKVGEGGMGTVYKAEHCLMEKIVALKVLNPSLLTSKTSLERFRREIRAASRFQHKNVIQIYDAGEAEGGLFYMAMEFAEGETLEDVLQRHRRGLPIQRAVALVRQVLGAVGEAHKKGIVHRDLKSGNIMIVRGKEGEDLVKVMDFGIAKIALESQDGDADGGGLYKTQEGVVTGTPQYMSPEQCSGEAVDGRSDLYSLGVILFEMLTGELPFKSNTPMGYLGKHIVEPPPPPSSLRSDLPPALEQVTLRLLEKKPEARFQSAEEVLAALDGGRAPEGRAPALTVAAPAPIGLTVEVAAPLVEAAPSPAVAAPVAPAAAPAPALVASATTPSLPGGPTSGRPILLLALGLAFVLIVSVSTTVALLVGSERANPALTEAARLLEAGDAAAAIDVLEPIVRAAPDDAEAAALLSRARRADAAALAQRADDLAGRWRQTRAPQDAAQAAAAYEDALERHDDPAVRARLEQLRAEVAAASAPAGPREPTTVTAPPGPSPADGAAQVRAVLGQLELALRAGRLDEAAAHLAEAERLLPAGHTDLEVARRTVGAAQKVQAARAARDAGDLPRARRLLEEAVNEHPDRQQQAQLRRELDALAAEADARATRAALEARRDEALARSLEAASALDLEAAAAALAQASEAARELGDDAAVDARARALEALSALAPRLREAEEQLWRLAAPPAGSEPPGREAVQALVARLEELRGGLDALAPDAPLASALRERLAGHLERAERLLAAAAARPERPAAAADERVARFRRMVERVRALPDARETRKLVQERLERLQQLVEHPVYVSGDCPPDERRWIDERLAHYTSRWEVWQDLGTAMVAIPGGAWRSPAGEEHALPELYYLGEAEVTCAEWDQFLRATGRPRPRDFPGPTDDPVRMISLDDANEYCRWRSRRPDGQPRRVEFRLPTEAEWERAARAAAGNEYPWGPTFEEWREGYAAVRGVISRVRSFQKDKNEWGLFDMVGNVQELTSTRRDGRIVVKGGSIATARDQAGASAVKLVKPGEEVSPTIGLRVLAVERAP